MLRDASVARSGERPPLAQVSLEVQGGEVLAIAGVAGNGQRTLADLLSGLLPLNAGSLEIAGRALPADPRTSKRSTMVRAWARALAVRSTPQLAKRRLA